MVRNLIGVVDDAEGRTIVVATDGPEITVEFGDLCWRTLGYDAASALIECLDIARTEVLIAEINSSHERPDDE